MFGHNKLRCLLSLVLGLLVMNSVSSQRFAYDKIDQNRHSAGYFTILPKDHDQFKKRAISEGLKIINSDVPRNPQLFHLNLTIDEFLKIKHLTKAFDVRFEEPTTESFLSDYFPEINAISISKKNFPSYFQVFDTLSLKENLPDLSDIDIAERIHLSDLSAEKIDEHATEMSTIIVGNGNTFYTSLGIVPEAHISSTDFLNLSPDPSTYFETNNIDIQNHSYGVNVEDYYGLEANAYDEQVYNSPHQIHVFSSGNLGQESAIFSDYAELPNSSNLSGTFKHAKNVLTVGAIDSFSNVLPASSRGPAYDGRIKPELVAYGYKGTSDAAAITSGCAAVVRNALKMNEIKK